MEVNTAAFENNEVPVEALKIEDVIKTESTQESIPTRPEDSDQIIDNIDAALVNSLFIKMFPNELRQFAALDLNSMSQEDLKKLRRQFEAILSVESGIENKRNMYMFVISKIEKFFGETSILNCTGLAQILSRDEKFMKNLTLVVMKNLGERDISPEYNLLQSTIYAMIQVDQMNSDIKKANDIKASEITNKVKSIMSKFPDL